MESDEAYMETLFKQEMLNSNGQNPGTVRSAAAYSNRQHAITFDRVPLFAIDGNIASRAGRVKPSLTLDDDKQTCILGVFGCWARRYYVYWSIA